MITLENGSKIDFNTKGDIVWINKDGVLIAERPPYGAEKLLIKKNIELQDRIESDYWYTYFAPKT